MSRPATLLFLLAACPGSTTDPTGCVPTTVAEAAACVDATVYADDLNTLAIERPAGSSGAATARKHCEDVLIAAGFTVETHPYGTGTNIIGRKTGMGSERSTYIVSAHYDSVEDCVGADDNASGVAGALGVARALAQGTFTHDLVIACWDEEELGLIGSQAYAEREADADADIAGVISLEMIAYTNDEPESQDLPFGFDLIFPEAVAEVEARDNRGDFIALVSDESASRLVKAFRDNAPDSLPTVGVEIPNEMLGNPALSDLERSDHASFWLHGYPAIMITDTADFRYGGYHCGDGEDSVDRLDLDFAVDVTRATAAALAERLELVPAE
jgi:Zn-dependent M28 family amino/carboxypeptidase